MALLMHVDMKINAYACANACMQGYSCTYKLQDKILLEGVCENSRHPDHWRVLGSSRIGTNDT
eukprot:10673799-Karenia_brevis.AAC.1